MAQTTTKLQLVKPEVGDSITPTIFANNFQAIDDAFVGVTNQIGSLKFKVMTQSAYNALSSKDSNTIYFLT